MSLYHPGVTTVSIAGIDADGAQTDTDEVSVEEPLEMVVCIPHDGEIVRRSLAVTMRTPGADLELTAGFLLTEGIIGSRSEISDLRSEEHNRVVVSLSPTSTPPTASRLA